MTKIWEAFTEDRFSGWWAIRDANDGLEVGSCDGGFSREEAHLMAAAPELLEACKRLLVCMNLAKWEGDDAAIYARATIAKATAEQ